MSVCVSVCGTGNCLGESGSEALREVLEAKGLADCLESLSDDEGTDSEGEEDQEHEREQGEEGEEREEEGEEREEEGEGDVERKATSSPEPQVLSPIQPQSFVVYRGHPPLPSRSCSLPETLGLRQHLSAVSFPSDNLQHYLRPLTSSRLYCSCHILNSSPLIISMSLY